MKSPLSISKAGRNEWEADPRRLQLYGCGGGREGTGLNSWESWQTVDVCLRTARRSVSSLALCFSKSGRASPVSTSDREMLEQPLGSE